MVWQTTLTVMPSSRSFEYFRRGLVVGAGTLLHAAGAAFITGADDERVPIRHLLRLRLRNGRCC